MEYWNIYNQYMEIWKQQYVVKFMFFKKATKIDEIFTMDCECQIDVEDFINFCDLLRKNELYESEIVSEWYLAVF